MPDKICLAHCWDVSVARRYYSVGKQVGITLVAQHKRYDSPRCVNRFYLHISIVHE